MFLSLDRVLLDAVCSKAVVLSGGDAVPTRHVAMAGDIVVITTGAPEEVMLASAGWGPGTLFSIL